MGKIFFIQTLAKGCVSVCLCVPGSHGSIRVLAPCLTWRACRFGSWRHGRRDYIVRQTIICYIVKTLSYSQQSTNASMLQWQLWCFKCWTNQILEGSLKCYWACFHVCKPLKLVAKQVKHTYQSVSNKYTIWKDYSIQRKTHYMKKLYWLCLY